MTKIYFLWIVVVILIISVIFLGVYAFSTIQEIGSDDNQHEKCIEATVDSLREFRKDPNNTHRADVVFDNILLHSTEKDKQELIERYNKL